MKLPQINTSNLCFGTVAALLLPACAATPNGPGVPSNDVVLHGNSNYSGPALPVDGAIPDLVDYRFNDQTSSISIQYGAWEVCSDANYQGQCAVLSASEPNLQPLGLNDNISSLRPAGQGPYAPTPDTPAYYGGIVLYSDDNLRGDPIAIDRDEPDLVRVRFNDRAESVEVRSGVWSVCTDDNYRGRCANVDRTVSDLSEMGLSGNISSVRKVSEGVVTPVPGDPSPTGQGYPGETTTFYPAPLRGGVRVNNYGDAPNQFCREEGHTSAVYFNPGPVLSDLLCR